MAELNDPDVDADGNVSSRHVRCGMCGGTGKGTLVLTGMSHDEYHEWRRNDPALVRASHDPAFIKALDDSMAEFEGLYRRLADS